LLLAGSAIHATKAFLFQNSVAIGQIGRDNPLKGAPGLRFGRILPKRRNPTYLRENQSDKANCHKVGYFFLFSMMVGCCQKKLRKKYPLLWNLEAIFQLAKDDQKT
jgi:hypothetical protein